MAAVDPPFARFLSAGEDERALVKAVESGDFDLVFAAVHCSWRRLQRALSSACTTGQERTAAHARFWALAAAHPSAFTFFTKYYRHSDPALLLSECGASWWFSLVNCAFGCFPTSSRNGRQLHLACEVKDRVCC